VYKLNAIGIGILVVLLVAYVRLVLEIFWDSLESSRALDLALREDLDMEEQKILQLIREYTEFSKLDRVKYREQMLNLTGDLIQLRKMKRYSSHFARRNLRYACTRGVWVYLKTLMMK
jgi:hypothetical protein